MWDLDQAIIHSLYTDKSPEEVEDRGGSFDYYFNVGTERNLECYYGYIRTAAIEAIQKARDILGVNRVQILTAASADYAHLINEQCGLGFKSEHIHSREDWASGRFEWRPTWKYFNNAMHVLIDNQHYCEGNATGKMKYLGISSARYVKVREFNGINSAKDSKYFLRRVDKAIALLQ